MTRRTVGNEAYYTPALLAEECIATVESLFPLSRFGLIVEPSAGDGAFYRRLPPSCIGIDIEPKNDSIVEGDFLLWSPPENLLGKPVLTVGNPPFGARGSLAVQFIQHAAVFSDVIAFILPMSFNKDTFQNRVPLPFHLVYSKNCTSEYLHDNVPTAVKTVFQIWERRKLPRTITSRPHSHEDFTLKHAHLSRVSAKERTILCRDYDFAIAQVGSNFRPKKPESVTQGSHWFVKVHTPQAEAIFERLDFSFLQGKNTAHTSLSRKDIVEAYLAATNSPSS